MNTSRWRARPPTQRRGRAVTLMELLIGLLILAILAGIAAVAYTSSVRNAQDRAAVLELDHVAKSTLASLVGTGTERSDVTGVLAVLDTDRILGTPDAGFFVAGEGHPSSRYREISVGYAASIPNRTGLAMLTPTGNCAMAHVQTESTAIAWLVKDKLGANCSGGAAANTEVNDSPGYAAPGTADESDITSPDAPDSVTAEPAERELAISWTGPDADDIEFLIVTVTGPNGPTQHLAPGGSHSLTVTGLTPDTDYEVSITAYDTSRNASDPTPPLPTRTLAQVPDAATGIVYTIEYGEITLDWAPVMFASSYQVFRDDIGFLGVTVDPTFHDADPVPGHEHTYTVVAASTGGTGEPAQVTVPATLPAPADLAGAPGATQIDLTWSPVAGDDVMYRVEIAEAAGGPFTELATNVADPQFLVEDLTENTRYWFAVTAISDISSSKRAVIDVSTLAPVPAAVTGLTGSFRDGKVTVSWDPSPNASSYQVFRDDIGIVTVTAGTSIVDPNVAPGTTYTYTVVAVSSGGSSDPADVGVLTAPPAPEGLSSNPDDRSVQLTWDPVDTATCYTVYVSNDGATWRQVGTTTTETAYEVDGLVNGTKYHFRVTACNDAGESVPSATTQETPAPPEAGAPSGLKATPGNTQVALTWKAGENATSHKVYRSTDNVTYTLAATVTGTSATVTGLTNNTLYYFKVSATNLAGESPRTAAVSARPQPPAPPTPTGVKATLSGTTVTVSWTASSGATSYEVRRGTTLIATVTTTSVADLNMPNGTTWSYTVTAKNTGGNSAASAVASVTRAPAAVTVTAANVSTSSIKVTWTAAAGATSYLVRYSTSSTMASPVTSSCAVSPCTIAGLTSGTLYYTTVTATNGGGSTVSAIKSAATTPAAPGTPNAVVVTDPVGVNGTISWPAVSGATYSMQRTIDGGNTWTASTSGITGTSTPIGGAAAGITYGWRMVAHKNGLTSAPSGARNWTPAFTLTATRSGTTAMRNWAPYYNRGSYRAYWDSSFSGNSTDWITRRSYVTTGRSLSTQEKGTPTNPSLETNYYYCFMVQARTGTDGTGTIMGTSNTVCFKVT